MPARFARLRIAGFKSFAEPTTVEILPGLTGIVGPNGCGKSNVVEALRWAMGEANARTLRGGEMEDVIFAGTAGAPVAQPRRGDADAGGDRRGWPRRRSTRRRNWRSSAQDRARRRQRLPRQRQGGAGARRADPVRRPRLRRARLGHGQPGARRRAGRAPGRMSAAALLEEAAGITGLHARRHEAELKLRAAEPNLLRAEDLKGQLEAQLDRAEAAGAPGQPLPQHLRRDPPGRGRAARHPARAGRAGAGRRPRPPCAAAEAQVAAAAAEAAGCRDPRRRGRSRPARRCAMPRPRPAPRWSARASPPSRWARPRPAPAPR